MIYVILEGRLGNQLFMYAHARKIQRDNPGQIIVIDDVNVRKLGYENLLPKYNFKDVQYVHTRQLVHKGSMLGRYILYLFYRLVRKPLSYWQIYRLEKMIAPVFNKLGMRLCKNGYIDFPKSINKNLFIAGYYQSDKYFSGIEEELRKKISLCSGRNLSEYPGIDKIKNRNSVCISVKVQHNVDNAPFNVCNSGYWLKAIEYIKTKVPNPLFFICSDDIEYVKNNLIDTSKYDVVCQSSEYSVHESLAVMGLCKHFIIGNTTYGWWAQFLGAADNKIVVAPSRWWNLDVPIDIYQDNWHLIEV